MSPARTFTVIEAAAELGVTRTLARRALDSLGTPNGDTWTVPTEAWDTYRAQQTVAREKLRRRFANMDADRHALVLQLAADRRTR